MVVCVSATMSILPVESMRSTFTRKPMALRIVLIISRARLWSPAFGRGRQTTGARRRMKGRVFCPWMNCIFCRCWLWNMFFVVQTLCQRAPFCQFVYIGSQAVRIARQFIRKKIVYKWSPENRFFSTKRSLGRKWRDYGLLWYNAAHQCIVFSTVSRRCQFAKKASPLQCNRDAVTVQSRCHYGVTATRLHRNGNAIRQ